MRNYFATAAILLFSVNLFCQDIPLAEQKLTSFYNWYIASIEQQQQGLIKMVTSPGVIKSKEGKAALQVEEYIRAMRDRDFGSV